MIGPNIYDKLSLYNISIQKKTLLKCSFNRIIMQSLSAKAFFMQLSSVHIFLKKNIQQKIQLHITFSYPFFAIHIAKMYQEDVQEEFCSVNSKI